MIELPEAITLSKQIKDKLVNHTLKSLILLSTPHKFAFGCGKEEEFKPMFIGKKLTDAYHYGGLVILEFEDNLLVLSDGSFPTYLSNVYDAPKSINFFSTLMIIPVYVLMFKCMVLFIQLRKIISLILIF